MLIDLLNSASYIMLNIDAIRLFGLNAAAYCAELLTIYKKAFKKKKMDAEGFFVIDRDYVKDQIYIEIEDQLKCDIKLSNIGIITVHPHNVNAIKFDVEKYASLLASEDIQLTKNIKEKMDKTKIKGSTAAKKNYVIQQLKAAVECRTPDILCKLYDWIEAVCATKPMTTAQVKLFKNRLDDYCDGDMDKALKILDLAIIHSYIDCDWAINLYEKGLKNNQKSYTINPNVRVTSGVNTRCTALGKETF